MAKENEDGLTLYQVKMREQNERKSQEYFDILQMIKKNVSLLKSEDFINIFQNEMDKRFRGIK